MSASVQAGINPPPTGSTPPGSTHTPLEAHPLPDGHCSERYASYWNAFLLCVFVYIHGGNLAESGQIYANMQNLFNHQFKENHEVFLKSPDGMYETF